MTCGPYLPIYLDSYSSRIENLHVVATLADSHESANISITVNIAEPSAAAESVEVIITNSKGNSVYSEKVKVDKNIGAVNKTLATPDVWWPNGQGDHPLYTATVRLLAPDGSTIDTTASQFGIRRIELIQRRLDNAPGKTFMFRINGREIFIQGGDWIPAEMFIPSVTENTYSDWMSMAAKSNLNMIRVWGGGIYETENFWDACDQNGLLVWVDYAFACGHFPVHEEYLRNVEAEARVQTTRIRNRASLAILCGGNEDFLCVDHFKPGSYDIHDTEGPFLGTYFDWREIYLKLLPKVAKESAPQVPYWPSSPWGGDSANDLTAGDVHQWSGKSSEPYLFN